MTQFRPRGAVAPLRRPATARPGLRASAARRTTVDAAVAALRPQDPLHCLRPQAVTDAARAFVAAFPGDVLYAVKCNAEPTMLRAIAAGGVAHFDCASEGEVRLVRSMFPQAAIHFMHPVKSRAAIRGAWAEHGVRDFVLDADGELTKILEETGGGAGDLGLVVRLALPKGSAAYDLSGKFGAAPEEAAALLRAARPHAARLGLSFHVGSQCLDPAAWTRALALAAQVIAESCVAVEIVDVGGGFPVAYPGSEPPPLAAFMDAIRAGAALLPPGVRLWAEPGRALVAGGASVVVQVQARRGDALYVNDGVYGALSDAGAPGFRFPHRLVRPDGAASSVLRDFTLFGPTCDSADVMRGPWSLPADVREGDWIEIGQLGAYGSALRTAFNGFDRALVTEVTDSPMLATAGYEAGATRAA